MLEFFRKYQRILYLIVTFFVVISFSFFGTFNAILTMRPMSTSAFTAVDGTQITRADVDELAMFLATDAEDQLIIGPNSGANFFNDGVIKKDFMDTGLALVLAEKFSSILGPDLQAKLEKEKRFTGYKHPNAPFLTSTSVWNYFAPEINEKLSQLQQQQDAGSPEALRSRIELYLAQQHFPEPMLKQILMYQQQQYGWIKPDNGIVQNDLSLFGYHTVSDWFGQRFIRLMAEFIINSAIQARSMGYEVSREEALADLIRNSSASYQQYQELNHLGMMNSNEYFRQQLQRLNIDQGTAIHLWQQVLLFRRMYNNAGNLAMVDNFAFERFGQFAAESVSGTLYELPKPLQFNDFNKLQAFETYLKSVTKKGNDPLALPTNFLPIEEIAQKNPELVQKRYILQIASVDKRSLQGRVSIREMWNWESSNDGWQKLQNEFPELAKNTINDPTKRLAALDALDPGTRAKVDFFSRKSIIDSHSDWLSEALSKAPSTVEEVAISLQGGATPFVGLKDNLSLIRMLDGAPIGAESNSENSNSIVNQANLNIYSADDVHYYAIKVVEKPKSIEIIPFAEAQARGLITPIQEAFLKGYYLTIREKTPNRYKRSDGNWKSFEEVRDEIATDYFGILLKNIRDDAVAAGLLPKNAAPLTNDRTASLRFYKYMRNLREEAVKSPESLKNYVNAPATESDDKKLAWKAAPSPADQWKLDARPFQETRSATQPSVNVAEAFGLPLKSWSAVGVPVNGALEFFQLDKKGPAEAYATLFEKTMEAHALLGKEAIQKLGSVLIQKMIDKKAISLDFIAGSTDGSDEMSVPGTVQQEG